MQEDLNPLTALLCGTLFQIKVTLRREKGSGVDLLALNYNLAHYQEQLGKICCGRVADLA